MASSTTKTRTKAASKKPAAKKTAARKRTPKLQDTLIHVVLDRSGSMGIVWDATVKGFNEYVNGQREQTDGGVARLSLVQFDDQYEVNFVAEELVNVPELDRGSYQPRGSTALNDAIGKSIHEVAQHLEAQTTKDRVFFVIITDGAENASKEFTLDKVTELIREKEKQDWTFVFIGANIDAFAAAQQYHIPAGNTMQYQSDEHSVGQSFAAASMGTSSYRSAKAASSNSVMAAVANTAGVTTAYDDAPANASILNTSEDEATGTLKPKARKK